jgi:GT2 family glycosyltransferase
MGSGIVKVSVVIACLNEEETLNEALESLMAQQANFDWEIVFADNGSTDRSREIFAAAAARAPHIPMRLVDVSHKRGKPHALNAGIEAAAGERLLFLDADDAVAPGWLRAMDAALDREPFVAARLDTRRLNTPETRAARAIPEVVQTRLHRLDHAPFCAYAGGATLGFHRSVFDRVGPFDPRFRALEDNDFCIRAHLAGYRLVLVEDAFYHYRLRSDSGRTFRQGQAYARHEMLLRKLYDHTATIWNPLGWITGAGAVLRFGALRALGFGKGEGFDFRYGRALGALQGGLAYGVAPPRRGLGLQALVRALVPPKSAL